MLLNIDDVAFTTDRALDKIIAGSELVPAEVRNLRRYSPWLRVCEHLAPSSLVIRLYILHDLYRYARVGKTKSRHEEKIIGLLDRLSSGGVLWLEGYSFWRTFLRYLSTWSLAFDWEHHIKGLIDGVNENFCHTSYMRRGAFFPAPFGYLTNEPLSPDLQVKCLEKYSVANYFRKDADWTRAAYPVTLHKENRRLFYTIKPCPVGLNTATPLERQRIQIMNGQPFGFQWFTSEFDKYKNRDTHRFSPVAKWKDVIKWKRVKCLLVGS